MAQLLTRPGVFNRPPECVGYNAAVLTEDRFFRFLMFVGFLWELLLVIFMLLFTHDRLSS